MNERTTRTHTLVIEIPLDLSKAAEFDYDPLAMTLNGVMSMTKLAIDQVLCDDITLELRENA